MPRARLPLIAMLALVSAACGGAEPSAQSSPAVDKPPVVAPGPWRPAAGFKQVPIWPDEAPDGTYRPQPPESVQVFDDAEAAGGKSQAVIDVAVPTMTVMPAKGRPTGTAVIVFRAVASKRCSSISKVPRSAVG